MLRESHCRKRYRCKGGAGDGNNRYYKRKKLWQQILFYGIIN